MEFGEKDAKKVLIMLIVLILAVLTYIILRPILMSVIGALILAYLFMPLYTRMHKLLRSKTVTAILVLLVLILVILIPLWFLMPLIIPQIAEMLRFAQDINIQGIIKSVFPTASEQFAAQMSVALDGFISALGRAGLEQVTSFLLDLPAISLHIFIICFVFFFALRDSDKLKEFTSSISPFSESKERILVKSFKDITDSVIYGQIIVGLVQGALAGLGFLIFGIDNALVLTLLATVLSITPVVGPFLVWIPISIYLFATGDTNVAIGYLLYNAIIVSTMDNVLRSYLVARRTDISSAIIFVGMMGGLFVFGIMGIILGPLILAYFLIFLRSYRDKTIYTLLSDNPEGTK